ncbi:pilus assembly PilX family protein [Crenobacter intestini]|uniref:Type 4 fimbrial biogenesis protein PilX N-terminal domain-containing protein n=1 Tax=Crenobacter intestini TaxID=2563443 RepID=A0A4T0ULL4_9NEIS|nr:PilX N-terminal domain-containing pilus assembly protein [Crenobacter intestini]TIC79594.1 hypothetical protein E5K04_13745 [Crenobacter intestini]
MSRRSVPRGFPSAARQRGVVLLVSMILLLLATVLGLSSMRNIQLQERMSANSYDRTLAYQSTEAALRAAEAALVASTDPASLAQRCDGSTPCDVVPAEDASGWRDVPEDFRLNSEMLPGNAQYFIQLMSEGAPFGLPEQSGSALSGQYGAGGTPVALSFRITARSHAPETGSGRAQVHLQTIYRIER